MDGPVTVKTSLGRVKGKVTFTKGSKKPVYNYLGIPYALPPTGQRRFQPPETPAPWEGILDGTKPGLPSPQLLSMTKSKLNSFVIPHDETSEDCLYLNIYSPDVSTDAKRPVLFFIHGGGFIIGMGDMYDGTAVVTYGDVVVVTFNYRLGSLGFLKTDDEVCPGNIGLLDQKAALKWINENVKEFGGDPENITIMGFSAGAACVQFMLLSPFTKGLFHKAVSQSLSSLVPNIAPSSGRAAAFKLGRSLGCVTDCSKTLVEYLRKVPYEEVITAELKLFDEDGITFSPSVDNLFLVKSPEELYTSGEFYKVPHIVGFTPMEGLFFLMTWCGIKDTFTEDVGFNIIRMFFKDRFPVGLDKVMEITKAEYFPKKDQQELSDSDCLRVRVSKAMGDMIACAPPYYSALLHSRCAPIYLYVFSHRPSYSAYPDIVQEATHGDDQSFVWGDPFMESSMIQKSDPYTKDEERLSKDLIQYLANFARTGDPNGDNLVEWPAFTEERQTYLNVDIPLKIQDHYDPDYMELWNLTVKQLISS